MTLPEILFTRDAARDIEDIHARLSRREAPAGAERTLLRIADALEQVRRDPEIGSRPPELRDLGVRDYHEVRREPYRIVYCVRSGKIFVMLVADGDDDLRGLLERRIQEA